MPTYPGSPQLTVDVLLRRPVLIARNLADLVNQRFVADRIFARGTPEQVASGVVQFQRAESIFPTRDVEEVGIRTEFPRTGWTEQVFTAVVRKYGLEVPIADEAVRRNELDQIARAQRKLANAMVKFVDTLAMTTIVADANINSMAASGDWTTAATDIVLDLANAKKLIVDQNEGYEADTLIVNPAQELDLLTDSAIRDALPREQQNNPIQTGRPMPIMGFRQILTTPQLTAGTVLVMEAQMAGTIADERPEAREGYQTYNPGNGFAPVYVKVYRDEKKDDNIVRAARFPAIWISEPKAVTKITGA